LFSKYSMKPSFLALNAARSSNMKTPTNIKFHAVKLVRSVFWNVAIKQPIPTVTKWEIISQITAQTCGCSVLSVMWLNSVPTSVKTMTAQSISNLNWVKLNLKSKTKTHKLTN
jgi:hypothetical protein